MGLWFRRGEGSGTGRVYPSVAVTRLLRRVMRRPVSSREGERLRCKIRTRVLPEKRGISYVRALNGEGTYLDLADAVL